MSSLISGQGVAELVAQIKAAQVKGADLARAAAAAAVRVQDLRATLRAVAPGAVEQLGEVPAELDPERTRLCAGLREAAGWFEAHPQVPCPDGSQTFHLFARSGTVESEEREVDEWARLAGVAASRSKGSAHYKAQCRIGQGITLTIVSTLSPAERPERHPAGQVAQ
jgi:hypothetical protein